MKKEEEEEEEEGEEGKEEDSKEDEEDSQDENPAKSRQKLLLPVNHPAALKITCAHFACAQIQA